MCPGDWAEKIFCLSRWLEIWSERVTERVWFAVWCYCNNQDDYFTQCLASVEVKANAGGEWLKNKSPEQTRLLIAAQLVDTQRQTASLTFNDQISDGEFLCPVTLVAVRHEQWYEFMQIDNRLLFAINCREKVVMGCNQVHLLCYCTSIHCSIT